MQVIIIVIILIIVFLFAEVSTQGASMQPWVPANLPYPDKIQLISSGIAQAEGFNVSGSLPNRANNPGDLTEDLIGKGIGIITSSGGEKIIKFSTPVDGWNNLYIECADVLTGNSGFYTPDMDFYDFGHVWVDGPNAPISNAANSWGEVVAAKCGVDPSTTLGAFANG